MYFSSALLLAAASSVAQAQFTCYPDTGEFGGCKSGAELFRDSTCSSANVQRNATWAAMCQCYYWANLGHCYARCPSDNQAQSEFTASVAPFINQTCAPLNINPRALPPAPWWTPAPSPSPSPRVSPSAAPPAAPSPTKVSNTTSSAMGVGSVSTSLSAVSLATGVIAAFVAFAL